uniref:Uncharacterized protein LOC114340742 isoform X1 n=1 Tax=Diabrotica virgifera virgifera TaxID=50390 RepID=A0A6P7GD28_DIAVI
MNSDDNEDYSDSGSEYLPSSDGNNEYSSDCDESLSNEQLLMELTANPISITPGLVPQPTPSTSAQADIPGTVQGEAVVIENEPAAVEAVVNQGTSATSRKRIRKEKEWKIHQRKKSRNSGKEYFANNGMRVPEKQFDNPDCGCTKKCSTLFTETERKTIFEEFWKLGNYVEQNLYLYGLVKSSTVNRKRPKDGSGVNSKYFTTY